ncbi:MAG: 3-methyl-2-oxobutanoate dehydrogenase subunit VorB [Candidatus Fermentibacteraceae bacterium]|nr:3-methyl-2-oxobutanoate dehydrogenase subunit VorB [Candidatus Fermentibacteraceae bacterium]MBN2609498.1 3-methyl-2-oxobutanoate dehydrogenase subunit VorB [Candidatus Fermentibacteraceae bacterium]
MPRKLMKGNYAAVYGAALAGCQAYYGYPITPASEIAESAAAIFPKLGRTFLQAESEVAAINMVYGAAGCGQRVMTGSSGPGISLKQEGLSYCAGSALPCVVVDIMRGGPGLGNIGPEQGDYNQVVKGGGHGNYKNIVLAPNSAQEMCDLTMLAFELADKYRNPVFVLTDGVIGQMMEAVELPEPVSEFPDKSEWAVRGTADSRHLINSIYLDHDDLEWWNEELARKYALVQKNEVRVEEYRMDDAVIAAIAYGSVSRVLRSAVDLARDRGVKLGMFRPVTLFPFPNEQVLALPDRGIKGILTVEMSNGQLVNDVNLALRGKMISDLHSRMGGNVPSALEIVEKVSELYGV